MKRAMLLFLILFQLSLIVFLGLKIYKRQRNIAVVVNVNPLKKKNLVFSQTETPYFFYEPKPDINQVEDTVKWLSKKVVYKINSDSLNERFNYEIEKSKDTFRIITLGDSHTFGLYVNTKDNWTEVLEDMLNKNLSCKNINKFEVINLGMSGYDIQYSIERFRLRGEKYHPDLILWFIKGEDFLQYNENMLKIKERLKKTQPNRTEAEYWDLAYKSSIKDLGENNLFKKVMGLLESFSNYYKNRLVVFTYPIKKEYIKALKNFVKKRPKTYFFDDIPNIYITRNLNFFPNDQHPNEEGHRIIAFSLFKYLTNNNKIIPCTK